MTRTGAPLWRLLIVGLGTLVVPLDSAVNVAFPAIVARFNLSIPMIQGVVISYTLTQTSLMLTFGRAGDMFGYRRIFLWGTGVSTLAFVGCVMSPDYAVLLVGRVAQGVGAGLILSCGPALATSLFPEAMRTRVLGTYMLMFGVGSALGPAVFGLLVQWFGWSAVWGLRAPVSALAFLLAWALPVSRRSSARERFDLAGGAILAVALALLLTAINQIRNGPLCAACSLGTVTAFLLFYRQEQRCPRPIIDVAQFRQPGFTLINLQNVVVNLSAFAIMLLAPFFLNQVARLTLPQAGLALAVSPIGIVLGAPIAGRLATHHPPRQVALAGMLLSAAGLFGISLAGTTPSIPWLASAMLMQGLGVGLFQVAYLEIVTASLPLEQRGVAGALGMATRTVGTVTGATVLMLVFQTVRTHASGDAGFTVAFATAFQFASALTMAFAVLGLAATRVRQRPAVFEKPPTP